MDDKQFKELKKGQDEILDKVNLLDISINGNVHHGIKGFRDELENMKYVTEVHTNQLRAVKAMNLDELKSRVDNVEKWKDKIELRVVKVGTGAGILGMGIGAGIKAAFAKLGIFTFWR